MPLKILKSDTNLNYKNTLQMQTFIQNDNKNTYETNTGKTHETKCININVAHELTQIDTYL